MLSTFKMEKSNTDGSDSLITRFKRTFSRRKGKKRTEATTPQVKNHLSTEDAEVFVERNEDPPKNIETPANEIKETLSNGAVSLDLERYYKLDDQREKIGIIFDHFKFEQDYALEINENNKDGERMENCLKNYLGFSTNLFQDLTVDQICAIIQEVSKKSSADVSCIVIVVMTHGRNNGVLCANDRMYPKRYLTDPFLQNTKLVGVPKIFIIQACRGESLDGGNRVYTDGSGSGEVFTLPSHADILTMYSTVEDFVSWAEWNETFFIQSICKQLEENNGQWDLLQLLTFVNGAVARNYESNTYEYTDPTSIMRHKKKQMPQIESTLTKLLKFPQIN